jgi:hypothetical protein
MTTTKNLFMGLCALALSGCGSNWTVADSKFFKFQNRDVRVVATLEKVESVQPLAENTADSPALQVRLYTANYESLLHETNAKDAKRLEDSNKHLAMVVMEDRRLGGTSSNSYPEFCAEIRMDHSNIREWKRIGCLHYTDRPSESPTGGLGI